MGVVVTSIETGGRLEYRVMIHGFNELLFLVRMRVDEFSDTRCLAGDVAYTVKVIANELATNAIAATPGEPIEVCLTRHQDGVLIEVWDSAGLPPVLKLPAEAMTGGQAGGGPGPLEAICENGRGLFLVDALAGRTGFRLVPSPGCGKIVWAFVPVEGA